MKIKNEEDLLSLLHDISRHIEGVAKTNVPSAVVTLVKARAKERGTISEQKRLSITKRGQCQGITERDMLPPETKGLAVQYMDAKTELNEMRARFQPLRQHQKAAEQKLIPLIAANGTVVRIAGADGRRPRTVRIECVDSSAATNAPSAPSAPSATSAPSDTSATTVPVNPATSSPTHTTPHSSFGMRRVAALVFEAAQEASEARSTPDICFDQALRACVIKRIRHMPVKPSSHNTVKLKTFRVSGKTPS
jgi:hypothetical protein